MYLWCTWFRMLAMWLSLILTCSHFFVVFFARQGHICVQILAGNVWKLTDWAILFLLRMYLFDCLSNYQKQFWKSYLSSCKWNDREKYTTQIKISLKITTVYTWAFLNSWSLASAFSIGSTTASPGYLVKDSACGGHGVTCTKDISFYPIPSIWGILKNLFKFLSCFIVWWT